VVTPREKTPGEKKRSLTWVKVNGITGKRGSSGPHKKKHQKGKSRKNKKLCESQSRKTEEDRLSPKRTGSWAFSGGKECEKKISGINDGGGEKGGNTNRTTKGTNILEGMRRDDEKRVKRGSASCQIRRGNTEKESEAENGKSRGNVKDKRGYQDKNNQASGPCTHKNLHGKAEENLRITGWKRKFPFCVQDLGGDKGMEVDRCSTKGGLSEGASGGNGQKGGEDQSALSYGGTTRAAAGRQLGNRST